MTRADPAGPVNSWVPEPTLKMASCTWAAPRKSATASGWPPAASRTERASALATRMLATALAGTSTRSRNVRPSTCQALRIGPRTEW
jgi:hypothetical protein